MKEEERGSTETKASSYPNTDDAYPDTDLAYRDVLWDKGLRGVSMMKISSMSEGYV
jgi:hypothetical protein